MNIDRILALNSTKDGIPKSAGVYYFILGKKIIYIGKTKNLRMRIQGHYLILKFQPKIKVYYNVMDLSEISGFEKREIGRYKPYLNYALTNRLKTLTYQIPKGLLHKTKDFPKNIDGSIVIRALTNHLQSLNFSGEMILN